MLRWLDCVYIQDVEVGGVRVIGCGLPDGFMVQLWLCAHD